VLYQSQPLIVVTPVNGADPEELGRVLRLAGGVVNVAMGVAALIWAATIAIEVRRLWRASRRPEKLSQIAR